MTRGAAAGLPKAGTGKWNLAGCGKSARPDAVSYGAIPFEGSRILTAIGVFQIASPDGFHIAEASLAVHVTRPRVPSVRISLGASVIDVTEFETWIPVRGVNHIFLERFEVSGIYQDIGEFWPARIAVDNVAITSIPEPRGIAIVVAALLILVPAHLKGRDRDPSCSGSAWRGVMAGNRAVGRVAELIRINLSLHGRS